MSSGAFDHLADVYDLLTDWRRRLPPEVGFLAEVLREAGVTTVLDAACGTGEHVLALARKGFAVEGADASEEMVAVARDKAEEKPEVQIRHASFAQTGRRGREFDAVLVIGNSLPAAGSEDEVRLSIEGLAQAVAPGGLLILHLLNYPALMRDGGGLRPLRRVVTDTAEHTFLKLFEVHESEVVLDLIHLVRDGDGIRQRLHRTALFPITLPWLEDALGAGGLSVDRALGGFSGDTYDEQESNDLLVIARKAGGDA